MRVDRGRPAGRAAVPLIGSGTATFLVFVRGAQVGAEQVAVTRTAEGWSILSTGRIGAPLDITARRMEVRYTADWKAVDFTIDATAPEPAPGDPHDLRRHDREERHHDRRSD